MNTNLYQNYCISFRFGRRKTSTNPMTTITPTATMRANLSTENQTDICPSVTAKAINPANAVNIQNIVDFLSWQRRHE